MRALGETIALGIALLALGCIVGHCTAGCSPSAPVQSVENAAAVGQYGALLDQCIAKGKDAGSLAVYVGCADDLDRTLCRTNGTRCQDGGR